MKLEEAGIPTVLVATGELRLLADQTAADLGLANLRIVSVARRTSEIAEEAILTRADAVVDEVLGLLTDMAG